MKVNKFRLVIDGKYIFFLTPKNLSRTVGNTSIVVAVKNIILDIEGSKSMNGMTIQLGDKTTIQVNRES